MVDLFEPKLAIVLVPMAMALLTFFIKIVFAVAIFKDASERRTSGLVVWFVHPIFWAGATLVGSVFVAAIYWAIHYSNLAPPEKPPASQPFEGPY